MKRGSNQTIRINGREIGIGQPVYIIAEMSANHNQDFDRAVKIIEAAKNSGADAIKLQTFTADTHTINSTAEYFCVKGGTPWDRRTLYDLYSQAYMPWEWQPKLQKIAGEKGLHFFSAAVDPTSVDFLKMLNIPAYKISSFEITDLALIKRIALTGKPLIISTGMASLAEIEEAVQTAVTEGAAQIALLKCNSSYPSPPEEMNLRTIPHMAEAFQLPVGLSDHTLGIAVPVAAVTLGACIIEKHLTLSRSDHSPDADFSLEPHEFKSMVDAIRTAEKALGAVCYEIGEKEKSSRVFRRSLFVVQNMKKGEPFTSSNLRSIRPGFGLHPRHMDEVIGRMASCDIKRGTPLAWGIIDGKGA